MASRKEEEKNERIIRSLLKLPENRRCINCNSLGPQYVCTNFWTFVCTNCGGIHREFTHRVKSISMAKFTSQEVGALQEGGNKRARETFFKDWDPQRHSVPDSSNVERLRDFIKHVYVDRRYSGERNYDRPPRVKMGDKEDSYENKRIDAYQGGSRSPPYEEVYERRFSERSSPGGRSDDRNYRGSYGERSPGHDQDNRQYGDYRRSPSSEVVNDWRREDRFGNGRKVEDRGIADGDSKLEGRSPEWQNDPGSSSPPVVRPVREILGENVLPLRVSEPPKANEGKTSEGSVPTQKTAPSSSLGSSANGNPVEVKWETSASLIDFDSDPQPPRPAIPQAPQSTMAQSVTQPASSTNDVNWASFDVAPAAKVSEAPSNVNTLDSVLNQLSVPAVASVHISGVASATVSPNVASMDDSMLLNSGNLLLASAVGITPLPSNARAPADGTASTSNLLSFFPHGASAGAPGSTSLLAVSGGNSVTGVGQWPNTQHHQTSVFPPATGQPPTQQLTAQGNVAGGSQPWNMPPVQIPQGPLSTPATQVPQAVLKSSQGVGSGVGSQPLEVKSSGRKELPADLFTASYAPFPAPIPGWQTGLARGVGFNIQYSNVMPMQLIPQPIPQPLKSTNPFDINNEPVPAQVPVFPSMSSLQGALPNIPPSSGLLRTSSLPSPAWMLNQASYSSAMTPQALSFSASMPQRPYMVQQAPSNLPVSSYQGLGGVGTEASAYGSSTTNQHFPGPANPNAFPSSGGNPFG